MKRLNVGAGRDIRPDFVNLDCVALPGIDVVFDLAKLDRNKSMVSATKEFPLNISDALFSSIPEASNTFDYILMSHVIEHLTNPLDVMQELWRIAKPNAICEIFCPYGSSDDAFEDPTHYRQYFVNSFGYFSQPWYWRADYGYRGDWQVEKIILRVSAEQFRNKRKVEMLSMVNVHRNMVREMVATLRAVKPAREAKAELRRAPEVEFELV